MSNLIHKAGMNARPRCGAESGKISMVGALSVITCPKCRELMREPTRAEKLAALEAQIAKLPSLRARIRSAQWMERTNKGQHEDESDKTARAEFQDELHLLPQTVRDAVAKCCAI